MWTLIVKDVSIGEPEMLRDIQKIKIKKSPKGQIIYLSCAVKAMSRLT